MGSKGGFTLLGLLIILSVLYDSGHSLRCYSCSNPVGACTNTTTNCIGNDDACLYIKNNTGTFYNCWNFQKCEYEDLKKKYGSDIKYKCCQKDLCNKSGETSITMALLVAPLLTAFWKLLI